MPVPVFARAVVRTCFGGFFGWAATFIGLFVSTKTAIFGPRRSAFAGAATISPDCGRWITAAAELALTGNNRSSSSTRMFASWFFAVNDSADSVWSVGIRSSQCNKPTTDVYV